MKNGNISPGNGLKNMDWAQVWHQQIKQTTFRVRGLDFWNQWAKTFPNKNGKSAYVEEMLKRLELPPDFSVLDVGAGNGALAIPLARRVRRLTALDQSSAMLDIIAQNAARENIQNIRLLNLDWTQARVGVDFEIHDAVLVSRSLPTGKDVSQTLKFIDQAARHVCYITWKADNYDEIAAELCGMLGIEYYPLPEYTVLYNLLYSLGIYANVEIFRTSGERLYRSIDEAYTRVAREYPIKDARTKEQVMDFLASKLSLHNGMYRQPKKTAWAVVWWNK